jgi:aminoglycoside 2'-N-acetyltransferase I
MTDQLVVDAIARPQLSAQARSEIIQLCSRAYQQDFASLFETFGDAVHVLARRQGVLVSHALWVTRWLQAGDAPPLRTAYVEAVATEPASQGCGFATAVMRAIARAIRDFDLGGLSPSEVGFYERLGWELWRGPLSIRTATGLSRTPNDRVMILRLPRTPPLDLDGPLSAEWREDELW